MKKQVAFKIEIEDNVATALTDIKPGAAKLRGDSEIKEIDAVENIKKGHKIALVDIKKDEPIKKYGIVIGAATKEINKGQWVHLHCMRSLYDERSSHLDVETGVPKDIKYE